MTFQFLIIFLQCSALAAFLILWYLWVKKKLEVSLCFENEENILFPFRYFSWVLIGVILVTSVVQIHFMRVSASVHERLASIAGFSKKQELQSKTIEELKNTVEKLRKELDGNLKNFRAQAIEVRPTTMELPSAPQSGSNHRDALVSIPAPTPEPPKDGFAREAKASSASKGQTVNVTVKKPDEVTFGDGGYTMKLSRNGHATTDNLRVRQKPQPDAVVIDKITSGQTVKVTEKRIINDTVWFRIITPSGRAGWVDYRYLKLEGNA